MTQRDIVKAIAEMNNERQNKVFENLRSNGLTEKEVNTIREMVFFYKLYNDKTFYDATVEALGNNLYETLRA